MRRSVSLIGLGLGSAILLTIPAASQAQLRSPGTAQGLPAVSLPYGPPPPKVVGYTSSQPGSGSNPTNVFTSNGNTINSGAALGSVGGAGVNAGNPNPFFNNQYNAQFNPLLSPNPYANQGNGVGNPYANPYGNPYANPYGNPYANPYGNPYANPYGNPYANPYANPYLGGGTPVGATGAGMYPYVGFMSPMNAYLNNLNNQYLNNPLLNPMSNPAFSGPFAPGLFNSSAALNAMGMGAIMQNFPMLGNGQMPANNNNNNNRAFP